MSREIINKGSKGFKGKSSSGKEKKSFRSKEGKSGDGDKKYVDRKKDDSDSSEKSTSVKRDRPEKRDNKPSFDRYRDESRPSDFGTPKKRSASGFNRTPADKPDTFDRKKSSDDKPSFKKRSDDKPSSFPRKTDDKPSFKKKYSSDEKPAFKKRGNDTPKSFGKKDSSPKPFFRKSDEADFTDKSETKGRGINPYDIDERDFKNTGETPSFKAGSGFKRKPLTKKSATGKGKSKPQRTEDDGLVRLNKYIANAGICSRREADDLIATGVVQVNGKTITEMGYRVKPTDIIKYGGQTLKKERLVYLILNKPKDYITTADDPQERRTVFALIEGACRERIYPVGRLDRATTGLLMFTNDGDLTKKLTHPRYGVRKIYHAELDKPLKRADLDKITEGLELEDGSIKVDEISYVGDGSDKTQVGVEIHSGKNRIVRRLFEHLGYNVRKLDRVVFGPLTKKELPRGRYRLLTDAEVGMLKMISAE
jgi:23S rRNA pseudouridine2605 synthase